MSELNYSSSMFLVAKKSGGKRLVVNLRALNKFVPDQTFKMEVIHLLLKSLSETKLFSD